MKLMTLLASTILAACVNSSPTEAQVAEVPVLAAYVTAAGDSLQLLPDGVFKARVGGYVSPLGVGGWFVGRYVRTGSRICARPNYFIEAQLGCAATVVGSEVRDPDSVFLWDRKPRVWVVSVTR